MSKGLLIILLALLPVMPGSLEAQAWGESRYVTLRYNSDIELLREFNNNSALSPFVSVLAVT